MSSVNDIDGAYYRISKSWRSLPRQDKQGQDHARRPHHRRRPAPGGRVRPVRDDPPAGQVSDPGGHPSGQPGDKQVALINLERLEAQADELGSAGKAVAPRSGRFTRSSSWPWNRTPSLN